MVSEPTIVEFAPAKINLTLHVTGQRSDGYHLLDSLVCFAAVGDRVVVSPGPGLSLQVTGPQSKGLAADKDNLVLRAAAAFAGSRGAAITLEKHLPIASGIGGGSSDAAAALRGLSRLWGIGLPPAQAVLALGADVPVCLHPRGTRMTGVGEGLVPVTLPDAFLVLVNPGVSVPTPAVFRSLHSRQNAPMPATLPAFADATTLARFLREMRNDLEPAAIGLAPVIAGVKAIIGQQAGCLIARMSGSGATCFGMFESESQADVAAQAIRTAKPGWWVAAGRMLG